MIVPVGNGGVAAMELGAVEGLVDDRRDPNPSVS